MKEVALSMRRILLVMSVAALMAAMMVASALPVFAQPSGAFPGPGNSGAAHACQDLSNPIFGDLAFKNHGQCVSFFAHGGQLPGTSGGGFKTPGGNA